MNLSLPNRFRIDHTWSVGSSRARSEGLLDIQSGVPSGSHAADVQHAYIGYAMSMELNPYWNYWSVVQINNGSNDPAVHVVLFPSKRWFDEWFAAIPAEREPKILLQCAEGKTGVE